MVPLWTMVFTKRLFTFFIFFDSKTILCKDDTYCWLNPNGSAAIFIWSGQTIFYAKIFNLHPIPRDWRNNNKLTFYWRALTLSEDCNWSHKLVRGFSMQFVRSIILRGIKLTLFFVKTRFKIQFLAMLPTTQRFYKDIFWLYT